MSDRVSAIMYRYSNKGELLGQLTSGDWEVERADRHR